MGGDGALEPLDGGGHAQHQEGIVEVGGFGIEEGEGLGGCGDAAGDEQLGEHLRKARRFGEGGGFFGMRLGEDPALARELAGGGAGDGAGRGLLSAPSRGSRGLLVLVVVVLVRRR